MSSSNRVVVWAKRPVGLVTLAWAVVSLAGVTAAVATPPAGNVSRTELVVGTVSDSINMQRTSPTDLHIQQVTIDPGATSGWHTHPGPEYSVLKSGTVILERAPACAPVTVNAGQGFFIPGGTPHIAHNDGTAPVELYVTYSVPQGTTALRLDSESQCGGK